MLFGTKHQLSTCDIDGINIGNLRIQFKSSVKNIGVYLDLELKMEQHVNNTTSVAWYHLRNLYKIRSFLRTEACTALVHAFVTSRIDLYNCLLFGIGKSQDKLQKVLIYAAKLILGGKKYDLVSHLLIKLHWLPVKDGIVYNILLITYKCLHDEGPMYL